MFKMVPNMAWYGNQASLRYEFQTWAAEGDSAVTASVSYCYEGGVTTTTGSSTTDSTTQSTTQSTTESTTGLFSKMSQKGPKMAKNVFSNMF